MRAHVYRIGASYSRNESFIAIVLNIFFLVQCNHIEFVYVHNTVALIVLYKGQNHYRVSTAVCGLGDKYKRKMGEYVALQRMEYGTAIVLDDLTLLDYYAGGVRGIK